MLTVDLRSLNLKNGDHVLDLGCGEGRHLHAMYYDAKVHAVGVDLSFDDVVKTRQGFERYPDTSENEGQAFSLTVANALTLPFADDAFDKIVCSEVLEHIPDYKSALNEIERILKPGGVLAVSVPRYWPEWLCWRLSPEYHNTPGGHVRIFRSYELKSDVVQTGLEHFRSHWAHGLHSPYWWLKCIVWEKRDTWPPIKLYHRFLVWDLMKRPLLTRMLEKIADPLMGKSVVLYFSKGQTS
jgi:SAM-dependent methyltransferase